MPHFQRVVPNLWFNDDAERAVAFYIELFGGREIRRLLYPENSMGPAGSVCTIDFSIMGMQMTAINGMADPTYTDACSLLVLCDDQAEVDRFWDGILAAGGKESMCGWIHDPWGMRWQIVPRAFQDMIDEGDQGRIGRAFQAMMPMKRLDLATLMAAADG